MPTIVMEFFTAAITSSTTDGYFWVVLSAAAAVKNEQQIINIDNSIIAGVRFMFGLSFLVVLSNQISFSGEIVYSLPSS
jgi:hypothetical protein